MATHAHKPISQQKLYLILEQCKQIPKDDRLMLRKMIKDGDEEVIKLLSDSNNKKIQVKLRKYLQKCKQNKKLELASGNRNGGRQNTAIDSKYLEALSSHYDKDQEGTTPYEHHSAAKSMGKTMKKSIQYVRNIKEFRQQLEQCRHLRSSTGNTQLRKQSSTANLHVKLSNVQVQNEQQIQKKPLSNTMNLSTKGISGGVNSYTRGSVALDIKSLMSNLNYTQKYSVDHNYLKEREENIFTPPEILKWDRNCGNPKPYQGVSHLLSLYQTKFEDANPIPAPKPLQELENFTSVQSWIKSSLSNIQNIGKQTEDKQKNIYEFKSALINCYAEDIFDFIAVKHFPIHSNQDSVYFPYRQFLKEIQDYLNSKGESVEIVKQNDIYTPVMKPFRNEYEGVSLKSLGVFLNHFCLHKNNNIRGMFIVLDAIDNSEVTLQKFNRINSWKGQQLVEAFEGLVRKWGEDNSINYWQVYRIRNQKQFHDFEVLYSKI